jgi:HEAT repeat protein
MRNFVRAVVTLLLGLSVTSPLLAAGPSEINGKNLQGWIKELKDPDPGIRERAAKTICGFDLDIAAREAGNALIDTLSDSDTGVRVNALITLATVGVDDKVAAKAVAALTQRLEDQQSIVRLHAAVVLAHMDLEARVAIPNLILRSKDLSAYEIRKAAVHALGRTGAADKKNPVDMRAARALIDVFTGSSPDRSAEVRQEAVMSLGVMGIPDKPADKQAELAALEIAFNDKDKGVAIWARVSYMALDDVSEKHLAAICTHLKGKDFAARIEAVRALGTMGPKAKAKIADLFDQLSDKEPNMIAAAAWAMGEMGNDAAKAVPEMTKMLEQRKDLPDNTKQALKDAIDRINGKPAPKQP